MRFVPRSALLSLCALGLLAAGCVSFDDVDFEGHDDNVVMPTGRVSFLVADAGPKHIGQRIDPELDPRLNRGWRLTVDGEVSRGQGSFDQTLTGGQRLILHDVEYFGPTQTRGRFVLTAASILAHGQGFVNPHLAFDLYGGLALTNMQARVSGTPGRDRSHRAAIGPELGVGVSVYPIPIACLFGRASHHFGLHAGDETELQRYEAGVSVELLESLSVFGAWRLWRYRADEGGSFHTDIDIDAQGPVIGLEFGF